MKICVAIVFVLSIQPGACAQSVRKISGSPTSFSVCASVHTRYEVLNTPVGCQRLWDVIGGTIVGVNGQSDVFVKWNDTPGAKARIKCKFICGIESENIKYRFRL